MGQTKVETLSEEDAAKTTDPGRLNLLKPAHPGVSPEFPQFPVNKIKGDEQQNMILGSLFRGCHWRPPHTQPPVSDMWTGAGTGVEGLKEGSEYKLLN